MGNVLPKRLTTKDQLLKYEDDIVKLENRLAELRSRRLPLWYYVVSLFLSFLSVLVAVITSTNVLATLAACITLFSFIRILSLLLANRQIEGLQSQLKSLSTKQKELIGQLKRDNNFVATKHLIEKYDVEESKESFFQQVQKRKRNAIDKISDYILESDPSKANALICAKCGVHNGLVDPANSSFRYFHCYHCKEKNVRELKDEKHFGDTR